MTDAVGGLRTALRVVAAATILLILLVGGLHGDGHLTTRGATGAIVGLIIADVVLAASAIAIRIRGGLGA